MNEKEYQQHPAYSEKKYVDWDEETETWCVFGEYSGFAYRNSASKERAQELLEQLDGINVAH
jgi:hypothetical protein